jgi:chorismate mutase-like protein
VTLPGLLEVRTAIDAVDQKILELLQERLTLVMRVGEIKRKHEAPIFDATREQQVLQRLLESAQPPLDAELVRRVFTTIVEESRRCEHAAK